MKVLIAYPNKKDNNPFVKTLYKEIKAFEVDIELGLDQFWNNYYNYDIIHIHWPNSLFEDWIVTEKKLVILEEILLDIKKRGIKIIYTRHNEIPHYNDNDLINKVYYLIENNCDVMVHLGKYKLPLLQFTYNNCKHEVIPHHIYEYSIIDKVHAKKKLGIPSDSFTLLSLGAIRKREEGRLLLDIFDQINNPNKFLIAPGLAKWFGLKVPVYRFSFSRIINLIKKLKLKKTKKVLVFDHYISEKKIPLIFGAADIVIIPRVDSLNSGILPLAYANKKVVIGPNNGNIGEILKETDNYTFEDIPNLLEFFENISLKRLLLKEKENYNYAKENWNIGDISKKYLSVYTNQ